jgi:hypothetical protein
MRPGWSSAPLASTSVRIGGRGQAGRADLRDGVARDQDVGRVRAVRANVEHPAAANDRRLHGCPPPPVMG